MGNQKLDPECHWAKYLPLYEYLLVFFLTCLLGCLLYFANWKEYIWLFQSISGMDPPTLNHHQRVTNMMLLIIAPILLTGGYVMGVKIKFQSFREAQHQYLAEESNRFCIYFYISQIIYYVLFAFIIYKFIHFDIFGKFSSWISYYHWVDARWYCFSVLNFFDFILIYTIIPITSIWILTIDLPDKWFSKVLRWVPFVLSIALCVSIFQKKAALIVLFMLFAYLCIVNIKKGKTLSHLMKICLSSFILFMSFFCLMVLILTLDSTPGTTLSGQGKKSPNFIHRVNVNRMKVTLLASVNRTSLPSLYYPIIFPEFHGYYSLDLGQHIFGYGKMPDDNVVVWNYLNPNTPGSISAPYQFILYSQVGVMGALLLSFFVGLVMGGLWKYFLMGYIPLPWSMLCGVLLQIFFIQLAIDSGNNSLLSGYGMIWGFFYIGVLWFLCYFMRLIKTLFFPVSLNNG